MILTILVTIVKILIVIIIILIVMSMNIIIIVIKITITEIMKITILLKLMKIVFQSHNPKTYLCSNSDNAQQEVQKNFLASSIAAPSATQQGTKNKDLHTLSSVLRPNGAIVFRVLLQ